uniref:Uncharacterized protein n=1 Tax=Ditylenchus dipsaci TaxID=166011 RepID=A0A915DWQ1_9BILA
MAGSAEKSGSFFNFNKSKGDKKKKKNKERDPIMDHLRLWRAASRNVHYLRNKESFWQRTEKFLIGDRANAKDQFKAYQQAKSVMPVFVENASFDLPPDGQSLYDKGIQSAGQKQQPTSDGVGQQQPINNDSPGVVNPQQQPSNNESLGVVNPQQQPASSDTVVKKP